MGPKPKKTTAKSIAKRKEPAVQKKRARTELAPEKSELAKSVFAQRAMVLELSAAETAEKIIPQLVPDISDDEFEPNQENSSIGKEDDDDEDEFDVYEPAAVGTNIEYGEGMETSEFQEEFPEGFLEYAWRRMDEDFEPEEDYERSLISEVLEKWTPPYIPFRLAQEVEFLRPWFENLSEEYPAGNIEEHDDYPLNTDIRFHISDSEIVYEIDSGQPNHLRYAGGTGKGIDIGFDYFHNGRTYVSSSRIFEQEIAQRVRGLEWIAQYLIDNQRDFIMAPNFPTALLRMRTCQQKDFLEFVNQNFAKGKYKKDGFWVSRLIKNKWVLFPFSEEPIALVSMFDEHIEKIKILWKLFEVHVKRGGGPPLTGENQAWFLNEILGDRKDRKKINAQQVRKTLWPKLRLMYPKDMHPSLRIEGEQVGTPKGSSKSETVAEDTLKGLAAKVVKELAEVAISR